MAESDSIVALIGRLRSREDQAAQEVFGRFAGRLVALARRRIEQRLAHRADPAEVALSALKSFLIRHREGRLQVGRWEGLWGLLALLTVRKCADRAEYLRAERREVRREVSAPDGQEQPWQLALNREPSPQEAAVLAETVERLFRDADPGERPVLELSLQGFTAAEISPRLGRALRTVQRLREQVRKRLERAVAEG